MIRKIRKEKFGQLIKTTDIITTRTYNGVTFTNNNDGSITLSGTWNANTGGFPLFQNGTLSAYINGHKYLAKCGKLSKGYTYCGSNVISQTNTDGVIFTADTYLRFDIVMYKDHTYNDTLIPQFFDLTYMGDNDITSVEEFYARHPKIANTYVPYMANGEYNLFTKERTKADFTTKVTLMKKNGTPSELRTRNGKVVSYQKASKQGQSVSFKQPYNAQHLTINGATTQNSESVRVLNVNGYGLRYNQLVENGNFEKSFSGDYRAYMKSYTLNSYQFILNHKYICLFNSKVTSGISNIKIRFFGNSTNCQSADIKITGSTYKTYSVILTANNSYDVNETTSGLRFIQLEGGTTTENDTIYLTDCMLIDLTDMFGSGNEPTTLDEFYATTQGKLYRNYVEYGYHILGCGEYKTNQLVDNSNKTLSTNGISIEKNGNHFKVVVLNPTGYAQMICNSIDLSNEKTYLFSSNKELVNGIEYYTQGMSGVRGSTTDYNKVFIKKPVNIYSNQSLLFYVGANTPNGTYEYDLNFIDLTDIYGQGKEPTTIEQIQATRPDLFVARPYQTTTKRYGFILSNGETIDLDKPLYGVGTTTDTYSTNGVLKRKYGVVDLGTLSWFTNSNYDNGYYEIYSSDIKSLVKKPSSSSEIANIISNNYKAIERSYINENNTNCIAISTVGNITIVSQTQTPSGVYLIYELATPTTEQLTPLKVVDTPSVNIWNEEWELGSISVSNGIVYTSSNTIRCKDYVKVEPNTTYYKTSALAYWFIFYDIDKNYIGYNGNNTVFTTPNNCYYVKFYFETAYGTTYNNNMSIYKGTTNKGYIPYLKSITNETFTETTEQTPATHYPEEIKGTNYLVRKGVNLFDNSAVSNIAVNSSGTIRNGIKIKAKGKTLTLSGTLTRQIAYKPYSNGVYGDYVDISSLPYTISNIVDEIIIYNGTQGSNLLDNISNVMLNDGTTALPYEPYYETKTINDLDMQQGDTLIVNGRGKNKAYLEQGSLSFNVDGSETSSATRLRTNFIDIGYMVQHYAICDLVVKNGVVYDKDFNYIGYGVFPNGNSLVNTLFPNGKYVRLIYGNSDNANVSATNNKIMVCLSTETDTSYEPYLPNKVWEKKVMGKVDLGTLSWSKYNGFFYTTISDVKNGGNGNTIDNLICSKYGTTTYNNVYANSIVGISGYPTQKRVAIYDSDYTDTTTFKNSLVGTTLVYELATPIWVDKTTELSHLLTLAKPNQTQVISVDNGNVKVDYYEELCN